LGLGTCSCRLSHEETERCVNTNDASYFSTELSGPFRDFFKPENHHSLPDTGPESGLQQLESPERRSKRDNVEIVNTEGTASFGRDYEELPGLTTKVPTSKGKAARQPPARTPSSESAASPKKPKAIKQALEKPHPAPEHWREMHDAIMEMRSRFPAPVDTMGCDTAWWKEMDPRVRAAFIIQVSSSPRLFNCPNLTSKCSISPAVVYFFAFEAFLCASHHIQFLILGVFSLDKLIVWQSGENNCVLMDSLWFTRDR